MRRIGVADNGLVDYEVSALPCHGPGTVSRLVLRSFSGRLVRVLAGELPVETEFATAGDWAAFVRRSETTGPDQLRIVDLGTGETVLRLRQRCLRGIDGVALERSGRFALMNDAPPTSGCPRLPGNIVRIGQLGNSGMRIVTTGAIEGTASIAMARGYVAYDRQTGRSLSDTTVMVAAPGSAPTPIPGMKLGPLAFDGRVVTTAYDDVVQLAVVRG
jgi:hypothetical protein